MRPTLPFLVFAALLPAPLAVLHAADADPSGGELLRLTADSRELLQRDTRLLTLEPVLLPCGRHLLGANDHFGWPVGVLAGKSIVVVFHRTPQHWGGKDEKDAHTSHAVVVRSTDGGKTWSEPMDLRRFVQTPTKGCRLGFGNTIGTDADNAVVVVASDGVFRSEDEAASWQHLPGAFGEDQLEGPKTNNGPQLAVHPEYGLVAAGHHTSKGEKQGRRNADGTPYITPELWMRWSKDGGRTWQETKQDVPSFATAVEPSALVHDGCLFIVARCHGPESFEPATKTWRYVQLWSAAGWLPLQAALTNIRASDVRDLGAGNHHGPWTQDTVDLSFNPVSGPDTNAGVQHIFIYAGSPAGPAGIFRLTRTLDTDRLGTLLRQPR